MASIVKSRTVAELEQAIMAGDTVTPTELGNARDRERIRELQAIVSQRNADQEATDAHRAEVESLRAEAEKLDVENPELIRLAEAATSALAAFGIGLNNRNTTVRSLALRARALGLTSIPTEGRIPDGEALGWELDAVHSVANLLLPGDDGDRLIRASHTDSLLDRVVNAAKAQVKGHKPSDISAADVISNFNRTVNRPTEQLTIRWLKGQRAGHTEVVSESTATWAVNRDRAEIVIDAS